MHNNKRLDYSQLILEIVSAENKRPIPVGIILRKVGDKEKAFINKNVFFKNVQKLLDSSQLVKLKSGKIVLGYPKAPVDMSKIYRGEIAINSKFAGFITLEGEEDSKYYVHKTNLGGALDGDTVEFALLKMDAQPDKDLIDAKVLKVISHKKGYYVGCYHSDGEHYHIEVDDKKMYLPVKLEDTTGLSNGTKFLFTVSHFTETEAIGKLAKIIGHINDVGADILSIVYDNGIEPEFPQEALDEAGKMSVSITDKDRAYRKDLTNLNIVTIDPATSKDFDDAIYTEKLEDGTYRLVVAIADVSHYVKIGTPLDQEALSRGCSCYLVNGVIPMLPHNISDEICSLMPNVERMAMVCDMIIDQHGEFKDIQTYQAIIKSHRRFSYDQVNEFFSGKSQLPDDTQEVKDMLRVSYELHKILFRMKKNRGYIELDIPEAQVVVDEKTLEPIDIILRATGEAQTMIEDFMVAANEAVTIQADKAKIPFIYRVHGMPEAERVETFRIEAKKLAFRLPNELNISPQAFSQWLTNNKDNPNLDLISIMMLRTMAKAEYDTKNIGHFGLASKNYTHFTSPIRRYPDVIVHRLLRMFLFDKNSFNDEQRKDFVAQLKSMCEKSNEAEIRAIQTERDVNALKFTQYMSKHLGEVFEVKVTAVMKFGCFVELPNTIEGLIRLANLKDDFYAYDEKNYQLIGKSGKIITLGTRFKAKCIQTSIIERKIEFEVVERIK